MRILLIDDEKDEMNNFIDVLGQYGHLVNHATNRSEIEAALASNEFDAIILDIMMPAIAGIPSDDSQSGYLAGLYIYENLVAKAHLHIPFVVLTAVATGTSQYAMAIRRLETKPNYKGVIGKPASAKRVIDTLEGKEQSANDQ